MNELDYYPPLPDLEPGCYETPEFLAKCAAMKTLVMSKPDSGARPDIINLIRFHPSHAEQFYSGSRQVDCTVIARAAEAGQLDFLKWCAENGHCHEFGSLAFGYAVKGGQRQVAEWLLCSDLIRDFQTENLGPQVLDDARSCGVSEDLLATLPFYLSPEK